MAEKRKNSEVSYIGSEHNTTIVLPNIFRSFDRYETERDPNIKS